MLFFNQFQSLIKTKPLKIFKKFQNRQLSISPWTLFLFYMVMFYMQYEGREKAAKVVEFVAKWLTMSVYGTICVWVLHVKRQALVSCHLSCRLCLHVYQWFINQDQLSQLGNSPTVNHFLRTLQFAFKIKGISKVGEKFSK